MRGLSLTPSLQPRAIPSLGGGGAALFVDSAAASTPTGASALAVPIPVGASAGELCLVCLSVDYGNTGAFSAPAGWTKVAEGFEQPIAGVAMVVWSKVLEAGDLGTSPSFGWNWGTELASAVSASYSGGAVNTFSVGQGDAASFIHASSTTTAANCTLALFVGTDSGTAIAITEPTGTTKRAQEDQGTTGGTRTALADVEQATAGATAAYEWTWAGGTQEYVTIMVALEPA